MIYTLIFLFFFLLIGIEYMFIIESQSIAHFLQENERLSFHQFIIYFTFVHSICREIER